METSKEASNSNNNNIGDGGITQNFSSTLQQQSQEQKCSKPLEVEQSVQRIYDILAEYAEQLRNSPDLNNKPAPRRRSNPMNHSNQQQQSNNINSNVVSSSLTTSTLSSSSSTPSSDVH